jgi:hypothetical protein
MRGKLGHAGLSSFRLLRTIGAFDQC